MVAIHSPQPIVRAGLAALLARHPEQLQLGRVPTQPTDDDPDVILFDAVCLLEGDTELLRYLVEQTTSKVVVVGRDLRPGLLGTAVAAGVDGSLSIGASEDELVAAVVDAQAGLPAPAYRGDGSGLSQRESQTLALIARGYSNAEIAAELYLSVNTVKSNIRTAYHKICVSSRAQAVAWAINHGYTSEREQRHDTGQSDRG